MDADLFESPKALLTWAYEDLERFKELQHAMLKDHPYDRVIEFDPETGRDAHRIFFTRGLPPEMRKLASHIINDLRHALDQAFVIASKFFVRSQPKPKHIYFPWASSRRDLEGTLKRWGIPTAIHPILYEAEPYAAQSDGTGGNDIVRQLGKIAGPNKHEAALVARPKATLNEFTVRWDGDWVIPFTENMWDPVKEQLTIGFFPKGSVGEYELDMTIKIAFRDIPELSDHAVSDVLDYWGTYANHFVQRFEGRVAEARG